MDKWESLKETVARSTDGLERRQLAEVVELRKELLSEIETAKNDSIVAAIDKLGERITRLESRLPEPEPEVED
jgi:uncharacterized protein YdcH (DUF465 family)